MSETEALDGVVQCLDTRCRGWAHDIIDERKGIWLVECCFCGTKQRMRAIKSHEQTTASEDFVVRGGRFDGKTLREIAVDHLDYIFFAAKEHDRQSVRAACQTFLDTSLSES